ncbi:MAG: 3-deoxy-D-manno-octulosonic-acid transferase, partial [Flavobacteriaceae bacterium]
MSILYQLLVTISQGLLPIAGLFFAKIRLFQTGRKEVFKKLKQGLDPAKKTLWLHAASLGEYEQGVPVLEALRASYPQ